MAEERIVTTETPSRASHTTVIKEGGGGAGWLIGIVVMLALAAGLYFFSQMSGSETAKDNAVANAASEVGIAAQQVGGAANDAGQAAKDAADK